MHPSEQKANKIKQQLDSEFHAWNHKQRYGLFSYLPHHGFGNREQNEATARKDEETGKVKTGPKNFQGGRPKSAVLGMKSFSNAGFLSMGDEYVDPTSIMKYRDSNRNKIKEVHGQAFKPSHNGPKVIKAPYEYITDAMEGTESGRPGVRPQTAKAESGRPGIRPQTAKAGPTLKNFITTPGKKGYGNTTTGHTFSSHRYVPDPYSFPDLLSSMERANHKEKFLSGPFQLTYKKRDHFTPNYRVYRVPKGQHGNRPQTADPSFNPPFLRSNPPKQGYNKTLNKFPEYVEETEDLERPQSRKEGVWRYNHKDLSQPTRSINQYNAKLKIDHPRQSLNK